MFFHVFKIGSTHYFFIKLMKLIISNRLVSKQTLVFNKKVTEKLSVISLSQY